MRVVLCVNVTEEALHRSVTPLVSERDTLRELFAHLSPRDDTWSPRAHCLLYLFLLMHVFMGVYLEH